MRLLHVIRSANPAEGGAIESIRQFSSVHRLQGHHIELACLDAADDPWIKDEGNHVHALGPVLSSYGFSKSYVSWLRSRHGGFDAVIVNGIWNFASFGAWRALRLSGTPYFVFPHGGLDPWFKQRYPLKHCKKWLYWPWAEYRVLRDARAVLFTCEEEKRLARQSFWLYRCTEKVVHLGIEGPPRNSSAAGEMFLQRFPELKNRRIILFLGRIHEKKGCDLLIKAFGSVASEHPELHLVIAGPEEGAYAEELRMLASGLSESVLRRITWTGMLEGALKWGAFAAADAFVLPSHQENFGIAVVEALASGLPVLISNKINIHEEVSAEGAGFVAEATAEATRALILKWSGLLDAEKIRMRRNARTCFESRFEATIAADKLIETLKSSGVKEKS